jgi:hypothetical protein
MFGILSVRVCFAHSKPTSLGPIAGAFSCKDVFQLEKSVAKQAGAVKHRCGAPHHDKKLKHEGHGSVGLIPIDSEVQRRSEKTDQQPLGEGSH